MGINEIATWLLVALSRPPAGEAYPAELVDRWAEEGHDARFLAANATPYLRSIEKLRLIELDGAGKARLLDAGRAFLGLAKPEAEQPPDDETRDRADEVQPCPDEVASWIIATLSRQPSGEASALALTVLWKADGRSPGLSDRDFTRHLIDHERRRLIEVDRSRMVARLLGPGWTAATAHGDVPVWPSRSAADEATADEATATEVA